MKKIIFFTALITGIVISCFLTTGSPAQAQEDLETVLARSAAKSFLITLTRPELADALNFYVVDGLRIESMLDEIGDVTTYKITREEWLKSGEIYQIEAVLQPGDQIITVNSGSYGNRWKVDGLELTSAAGNGDAAPTSIVAGEVGLRPVVGNGTGKLVFQTQSAGEIYLINADGTGLQYITHGIDPQLSPDGTQIAFTRWDPEYALFTINVDGSNERSWFGSRRQMKSPAWSADGSRLVFSYQNGGRLVAELNRVSLDTLTRRAIKDQNPINIPSNARGVRVEGGYLEFTIPADAHWWLAEINLNDKTFQDLSTGSRYNYAPSGNPVNPNQVIFRTDKGMGLYNAQIQTSQSVSFDDRDRGSISISPDGTRVAFTYFQDGNWEIHTINIDGTNRQRLTKTPLSVVAGLTAEDNHSFINEEGFTTMSRAQGGTMANVSWNNVSPVWSPDGSRIAFVTDRTGQWEIWMMNADGSNQRPMFSNGVLDDLPLNFAGVDERMLSWR